MCLTSFYSGLVFITFFKTSESLIALKRGFRARFHDAVPDRIFNPLQYPEKREEKMRTQQRSVYCVS